MKYLIQFAFCFLVYSCLVTSSCKKDDDPGSNNNNNNTGMEGNSGNEFENYTCVDLFASGDYSEVCSLDIVLPEVVTADNSLNLSGCNYEVYFAKTPDENDLNSLEYRLQVDIMSSAEQVESAYDDALANIAFLQGEVPSNEITNLGDESIFLQTTFSGPQNEVLRIYTRKSNVLISLESIHDYMAVEEDPVCTHSEAEMVIFVTEMLNTLEGL